MTRKEKDMLLKETMIAWRDLAQAEKDYIDRCESWAEYKAESGLDAVRLKQQRAEWFGLNHACELLGIDTLDRYTMNKENSALNEAAEKLHDDIYKVYHTFADYPFKNN